MGAWLAGWLVGNTLKLKPASYTELGKMAKLMTSCKKGERGLGKIHHL